MLEARNLTVAYGERTVVRDITLALQSGEVLVLSGPNGAGKSTLVNTFSGLIAPRLGDVLVGGQPLHALSDTERAKQIAVVPQAGYLPPAFTVEQVVLLGRTPYLGWLGLSRETDHQAVDRVLADLDLVALRTRPVGELSGGERQRTLLARALVQDTPVMLLDEPTTFLDLRHQAEILSIVRDLAVKRGLAVLVVLHDLNLAGQLADRIALLLDGRLQAVGRPDEVLSAENLSRIYGVPLQVFSHPEARVPVVLPKIHRNDS